MKTPRRNWDLRGVQSDVYSLAVMQSNAQQLYTKTPHVNSGKT